MNALFRSILYFFYGVLLSGYCFAQGYTYTYFNASNGLPTSEVISLAKDNKGFLWIGTTAGISRYDGYEFKNYLYSSDDYFIGKVNCIKEDKNERLWFGSESGLFYFSDNKIYKLTDETEMAHGINDILHEADGSIWLATESGPAKIPAKNISLQKKSHQKISLSRFILPGWFANDDNADKHRVTKVREATDGTIYFANYEEIYRYSDGKLTNIFSNENTEINFTILSIFPVSKSKVYFDESRYELHRIENGVVTKLPFKELYGPQGKVTGNGIWYTGTNGIFKFYPREEKITRYIDLEELDILYPSDVLYDSSGFWWLATHDGLIKFTPDLFKKYSLKTYRNVQEIYSFAGGKDGTLLLGSNRGKVYKYADGDFSFFFPGREQVFPLAEIFAIYEDDRSWLWFGSGYQGLAVYRNGKLYRFTDKDGLHDNSIRHFLKASNKKFYGIGDHGMSEIIVSPEGDISFKKIINKTINSQHSAFYGGIEAPDHTIWIGGEEGLYFLQADSLHSYSLTDRKLYISDLKADGDGNIWIATNGEGVLQCRFDTNNKLRLVKQYKEDDGLNTSVFMKILVDRDDNVWLSSPKGISFIGRKGKYSERVFNFTKEDGFLESGYIELTLYQDKKGIIWAGCSKGLTSFDPALISVSATGPPVYLTSVTLSDARWQIETYAGTMEDNLPTGLNLPYNRNSLSFSFTSPEFSNQNGLRYIYTLEGTDTGWINGGNLRSVSYQRLGPGTYTFKVRAVDNKGTLSQNEAVFRFSINSPFWTRWWFIGICLSAVAGLIYLLYQRRLNFIRRKEEQKTEIERIKASSYQYQLEIEQVINYFAASINEQQSIEDMLWDVTKNCISKLGFEDCVIYLKDEAANVLIQKAAWGPKTIEENKIVNPLEIAVGRGVVGSVAVSGKPEIIPDTSADARYIADDASRLSELSVPIVHHGKVIGVIDSEHPQINFYTQRHLQILTTVASLCADKMEKMKAEERTREKELELLKLSSELASSQLTALRAQMNPHFIFNALNSIQQFILQGNADEANKYLSRFSKLQREILNNSDQQFISLEKEHELLKIYLQLEQLRFSDNFSYEINIEKSIEVDEITIPPMIVQPFVENAIWHGLMPKKGDKKVSIDFSLQDERTLICKITDNGIGRRASAELKDKSQGYKSRGLSIVYERLKILEKQFDQTFNVFVHDMFDDKGNPIGTTVMLSLFSGNK